MIDERQADNRKGVRHRRPVGDSQLLRPQVGGGQPHQALQAPRRGRYPTVGGLVTRWQPLMGAPRWDCGSPRQAMPAPRPAKGKRRAAVRPRRRTRKVATTAATSAEFTVSRVLVRAAGKQTGRAEGMQPSAFLDTPWATSCATTRRLPVKHRPPKSATNAASAAQPGSPLSCSTVSPAFAMSAPQGRWGHAGAAAFRRRNGGGAWGAGRHRTRPACFRQAHSRCSLTCHQQRIVQAGVAKRHNVAPGIAQRPLSHGAARRGGGQWNAEQNRMQIGLDMLLPPSGSRPPNAWLVCGAKGAAYSAAPALT